MSVMKMHSDGKIECMCDTEHCWTFFNTYNSEETKLCKDCKKYGTMIRIE